MGKHLHFDAVGGASGDMILGALIDLGVDQQVIQSAIASLGAGTVHLHGAPAIERGISGTRVTVHAHEDGHADHDHGHSHSHKHEHAHAPHRGLAEIRELIMAAALPPPVQEMALRVFQRIGEAEAAIHGVPLESIHFHEVGALDSIADIVGSCLALHLLHVDEVTVGPLPMGYGTITCAHGVYPNPAPATQALSKGLPVVAVDEPFELVTPTGAALLSEWQTGSRPRAGARIARIGYGLGQRTLQHRANVLRATLLESAAADVTPDTCLVLECNIDDATPEIVGALTGRLLEAGALDVFTIAAQMKKQRPGMLLTVLCQPEDRDRMLDLIFVESTTFGVREYPVRRTILERRTDTVETDYGPVRVKKGRWRGREVTVSPEMEDCMARSAEHGVSVRQVYEAAKARIKG